MIERASSSELVSVEPGGAGGRVRHTPAGGCRCPGRDTRRGAEITWAWGRLVECGGTLAIATLVEEIGWSQRHLAATFREQIGLTPKAAARVLRFERCAG